jgi:hypothetical protein
LCGVVDAHEKRAALRRRPTLLALAAMLAALAVLGGTAGAASAATTYTKDCPPTNAECLALAERAEATNDKLDQLHADNLAAASPGTTDVAGTVALSPDDAQRLDLSAYGVWFLGGLLLILIAAPMFTRAFRFWH